MVMSRGQAYAAVQRDPPREVRGEAVGGKVTQSKAKDGDQRKVKRSLFRVRGRTAERTDATLELRSDLGEGGRQEDTSVHTGDQTFF